MISKSNKQNLNDIIEENSSVSEVEKELSDDNSVDSSYLDWTPHSKNAKTPSSRSPFHNEEILKKSGLKIPAIITIDEEIQATTDKWDAIISTELEITPNEMNWDEIDFSDDLSKEAAKTLVALDYYMKSWDRKSIFDKFQNKTLQDIDLTNTNRSIKENELVEFEKRPTFDLPSQTMTTKFKVRIS